MILVFLVFLFASNEAFGYSYSYVPKTSAPVIYNILYSSKEKCKSGVTQPYLKNQKVCASCAEDSTYLIDEAANKAVCAVCPKGTLLVKRKGYPMCLSDHPVAREQDLIEGQEQKLSDLSKISSSLNADYTVANSAPKKTFKNKKPLENACEQAYPQNEDARRQVSACRRLGQKNDFLCPYVQKNEQDKWTCRACPKNAPYKNEEGGCFNCPYGEEMILLENGETVCASQAPAPEKKPDRQENKAKKPPAPKAPAKNRT